MGFQPIRDDAEECSRNEPRVRKVNADVSSPGAWERRVMALVACLEVDALEAALLADLRSGLPKSTAIVRIGSGPAPSCIANGRGVRCWRDQDPLPRLLVTAIGPPAEDLGFLGFVYDAGLESLVPLAEQRLLELAALAVVPARNALRHADAVRLAYKDPLTALYNRRAFADYLERESQRSNRYERPLSVILIDLDGLKSINDTFGHDSGDRAIRAVADVLARSVRRADVCARLGGDEFAILLPDTAADAGRRIGSRVQRAVAAENLPNHGLDGAIRLSCSFGVADLVAAGGDPARMLEIADAGLYQAKRARGSARVAESGR